MYKRLRSNVNSLKSNVLTDHQNIYKSFSVYDAKCEDEGSTPSISTYILDLLRLLKEYKKEPFMGITGIDSHRDKYSRKTSTFT